MASFAGGVNPPLPGYHLTFADDFDAPSWYDGAGAGSGTWYPWLSWGNQTLIGNNEQEAFVWPAFQGGLGAPLGLDPFTFSNSIMTITTNPVPSNLVQYMTNIHGAVSPSNIYYYYSGAISTWQIWRQQYGYFELRCKIPLGQAAWPTFWLLPADGSWPPEIDVFEFVNSNRTQVETYHWANGTSFQGTQGQVYIPDCDTVFHTYGMEWTPSSVNWYLDGVLNKSQAHDFNVPAIILMNTALGGYWPGYVDATTPFPLEFQCDWVRAWSKDSNVGTWTGPGTVASNYYGAGSPVSTAPDTVVISASEDAAGSTNAQFTVTLDNGSIGSTNTVTTLHSSGNWQLINLGPQIGSGSHSMTITLSNPTGGLNLYLKNVVIDGVTIVPNVTVLNSTATFTTITFNKSSGGAITNTTSATPPDTIVINAAEQAYQGDAQFQLSMDGTNIGAGTSVTSDYNSNTWSNYTFNTPISVGNHTITVTFLNDSYGGAANLDRNLIVDAISVNGVKMIPSSQYMTSTGNAVSVSFTKNSQGTLTNTTAAPSDLISVTVSEDAASGDAQLQLYVDGVAAWATAQSITTAHATPVWTTVLMATTLAAGSHTITATLVNPAAGRNLYVQSFLIDGVLIASPVTQLNSTTQSVSITVNKTGPWTVTNTTAGAPSDTIVVSASEDASSGDATFQLLVDGTPVGAVQTVTAAHSAVSYQNLTLGANLAAGDHTVTVRFTNPVTGRNLYVQTISVDGLVMVPTFTALNGSVIDATIKFNKSSGGAITNKTPAGAGAPVAILQGTVGLPNTGADLAVGTTAITQNLPVFVSSWAITAPGA